MPDTIQIRAATINDMSTIVSYNEALAKESEGLSLNGEILSKGVHRAIRDPQRCHYYLAEVASRVVGQTMITREWSDWRDGWFWWIQSVYVDRAYRRRGVFGALYEHIRNEAQTHADVRGLRLYVHRDNQHAITTYEKLGMSISAYRLCEEEFTRS